MTAIFCAVDVGTASARAGLFDATGRMLARAVRPIALWTGAPGRGEQEADGIWAASCAAVRAALSAAGLAGDDIAALAFDATCSLVLRDRTGGPLALSEAGRDVIAWFDHRATEEAARCTATGHAVLARLGGSMSPEMQIPKLMWLKARRPDLWDRLGSAWDLTDWMTHRATGGSARSLCPLVSKWTYLPGSGGWQPDFLAAVGLPDLLARAALPAEPVPPGRVAGTLSAAAAAELGLAAGTPVAAGLIDAFAGALGLIAPPAPGRPGEAAVIAGTSSCVMTMGVDRWSVRGVWGPYRGAILPGHWVNEGGQSASGALLDYILGMAATGGGAAPSHEDMLARVAALLERHGPALGEGIDLLPDFNGNRTPLSDPGLRGVVAGLTLDRDPESLAVLYWRAAVSVALGLRQIVEHVRAGGAAIEGLGIGGGHARSPLLLQLYADATGCPVRVAGEGEAVLLGTAICAAEASGVFPSLGAAARAMQRPGAERRPDPRAAALRDRDYAVFLRMQAHRDEIARLRAAPVPATAAVHA
ncbi:FGGY family pentulose kinase [Roseivivax isoporae]|uniref:L-ribulokinase n=1 Tax=Roseivivax isoporae LMG 25204 TaxID=1449351 RepID=X7FAP1_9RHOB|nr:FGGY family pentulose kinase [Roseivivax isoporae]ETX29788.1 L-ribulokinase [Roseivivax isoporae LMG 25204]